MPSALVILTEELPVHPRELAPDLAPLLGMVTYDVISAFNRSRVLPFEKLDDQRAAAAVECLEKHGVPAAAVPAERLPPVPKVFTVHNADAEAEGLAVQTDLAGKMRTVPWDGIEALSAASLPTTEVRGPQHSGIADAVVGTAQQLATPLGGGVYFQYHHRREQHLDDLKSMQHEGTCVVLCVMPRGADVEIHFRADQFNYDYLGERLSANSSENFRTFATDVLTRTRGALVNPWARSLVETGEAPPVLSRKQLADHNQWLRLRAREGL